MRASVQYSVFSVQCSGPLSLTPNFSWVAGPCGELGNRFNGFSPDSSLYYVCAGGTHELLSETPIPTPETAFLASFVRSVMSIGTCQPTPAKLRRSGMTPRCNMPLLAELGFTRDHHGYRHGAPNGAFGLESP